MIDALRSSAHPTRAFGANRHGARLTTMRPDVRSLSLRALQIASMLLLYRAASARPLFRTSSTIGSFFIVALPPSSSGEQRKGHAQPSASITRAMSAFASSQAQAWEFGIGSSSFLWREARASRPRFPIWRLGTSKTSKSPDFYRFHVPA